MLIAFAIFMFKPYSSVPVTSLIDIWLFQSDPRLRREGGASVVLVYTVIAVMNVNDNVHRYDYQHKLHFCVCEGFF